MKKLLFFIFFLNVSLCYAQSEGKLVDKSNDSIIYDFKIHRKIYKIDFAFSRLSLDLIEFNSGEHEGNLNINYETLIDNKWKKFIGKKKLDNKLVKKLMWKLYKLGIEHIKSPTFYEGGSCLDGDNATVEIFCDFVKSKISFDCVTPKTKIHKFTPFNRKHFIKMMKFINRNMNLEDNSKEMRSRLTKGKYSYFEGIGLVIFNIK